MEVIFLGSSFLWNKHALNCVVFLNLSLGQQKLGFLKRQWERGRKWFDDFKGIVPGKSGGTE